MLIISFVSLGLLIGHIAGMTSAPVSNSLIGLIFAFGGGTAIGFLRKISKAERKTAAVCITSLCLSCLVGLYIGILVTEYRLLSPSSASSNIDVSQSRLSTKKYLREGVMKKIHHIDTKYRNNHLKCEEAYDEILSLID